MRKVLIVIIILTAISLNYCEVITITDNWGKHPLFNVISTSDGSVDITFSIHTMIIEETMIDGIPMKTYGIPGIFLPNDEGAPNLAGTGRYIAIPQGATAIATIIDARTEVYQNVEVAPAPNIPLGNDDSPLHYIKNNNIYSQNAYYPESPVKLSEPMKMRGVDCVVLGITPFQYNPVTKELIVYKDLRVRVDFIGGNGHFGDDALRNIYWEPILQGHLLNYNSLPQIDFFSPERKHGRDGYEYIIIVPDDSLFIAWADTIKRWRQLQGISTKVVTLSEIGDTTAVAIKNYLTNAYYTWNPRAVAFLILSDYPNSGERIYGVTSPMWNNYCVSDNIYADVDGDSLPEMFSGRICAQNEEHLRVMVNKFLSYERNPYTNTVFYDRPICCGAWQTERWFQLCIEVIRQFFINGLGKNPYRFYAIYSGTPAVGGVWSTATGTSTVVYYFYNLGWLPSIYNPNSSSWWSNGTAAGIINAINEGSFMILHRDHGAETGWGEPSFSNSNINSLRNTELIFVYSTNCLTGRFNWINECFAEKWHRYHIGDTLSGALAVNAPSEVSYSFVNDVFLWGNIDGLWQQFIPDYPSNDTPSSNLCPAVAQCYGKYFLQASSWPYNLSNKVVTYHLYHHFGDVFNPLYTEMPQNLTVSHSPILTAGATSFSVTANDSSMIALTVNGEITGVAQGTGNPVAITIPPQTQGSNVIVTVTKQNYYRYQATVPVVSSSYPYIFAGTSILNDSGANGQVNPGELIDYGVYAKNIGVGTAQGVYGYLSTTNPYVSIINDSSWFGTILVNDSILSNTNYSFRVANNCPNNDTIRFMIEFHDMNDSIFRSYKKVRVYAPVINYQSVAVVGGDSNGIFNRGETVNLVVTIKNVGGANAENVTANLLVNNPHITLLDNQGSFGSILPNTTASNSTDPFTVCSDTLILPGTMIQYRIAVNYGFYSDTFQFTLPVEIYFEDFETSNGGYIPIPSTGGWEWGSPTSGPDTAHSGNKVWGTILSGQYPSNCNFRLVTPSFTATGDNPQLRFWHWYQTEQYYDGGNVKLSTDGGLTWTVIMPVGGYPGRASLSNAGIPGDSCYMGSSSTWTQATFNLPVLAGQSFKLCWHFGSDGSIQQAGWYIDDVEGYGFSQPYANISDDLKSFDRIITTLYAPKPNPTTNGRAVISFSLAEPSKIALKIYNASGQLIKTLATRQLERGLYNFTWNGKDENKRMVSEGIYFYTLETPNQKFTKKLVLTR